METPGVGENTYVDTIVDFVFCIFLVSVMVSMCKVWLRKVLFLNVLSRLFVCSCVSFVGGNVRKEII